MGKEQQSHSLNVTHIRYWTLQWVSLRVHEPLHAALKYRRDCDRKHDSHCLLTCMQYTMLQWKYVSWLGLAIARRVMWIISAVNWILSARTIFLVFRVSPGEERYGQEATEELVQTLRGQREESRKEIAESVERERLGMSVITQEVNGKCWTGISHERNGLPWMNRVGRVEFF